jgi:hypothetical protein
MRVPKKIKGYKVVVNNSHKYFGTTDDNAKKVIINVKKHKGDTVELKDTLRHEAFHVMHPNATEKDVEEKLKHKETSQVEMNDLAIKGLV